MNINISAVFREYIFPLSIVTTIVGLIVFIPGLLGVILPDIAEGVLHIPRDFIPWSLYLLIIGFFILITGVWYLYSYIKNKNFILKELETNKRSEFIKKKAELHNAVKHLPSKYKVMLKEKEAEFRIK
ncbi:MAG: hypothetical protein DRN12_01230 [Thermoplasmata archaeon]|nr:MAG: hypothetical protein DRN12_01230 [Thermoplasmata archaeon]HEC89992.1 hypothetical protein [Thermoplasmatales archaeon]